LAAALKDADSINQIQNQMRQEINQVSHENDALEENTGKLGDEADRYVLKYDDIDRPTFFFLWIAYLDFINCDRAILITLTEWQRWTRNFELLQKLRGQM